MKKELILLIVAIAFATGIKAQADTVNYLVVYQKRNPIQGTTLNMAGFRTQGNATDFMNNTLDSTAAPTVYDVRTKKPMKATFSTVEVERVIRQRERKWRVQ